MVVDVFFFVLYGFCGEAPGERERVTSWSAGEGKKAEFPTCLLPFLHNTYNQH